MAVIDQRLKQSRKNNNVSCILTQRGLMKNGLRLASHRQCLKTSVKQLALSLVAGLTLSAFSAAQDTSVHSNWPGPGQLFVGTCYQPVDRSPEQIDRDIAIMKAAGFNVVRMGDLSWDSFEPNEGNRFCMV